MKLGYDSVYGTYLWVWLVAEECGVRLGLSSFLVFGDCRGMGFRGGI